MTDVNSWSVTAASNNSAPPDGWPEGMAYSGVNNSARENMAAVARLWKDINGSLVGGGLVNAYTVTLNAGYAAYFTGLLFSCSIPISNTGASTLNVNGIGAKNIVYDHDNSALIINTLVAGQIYTFRYDGTNLVLLGMPDFRTVVQNAQPNNYTLLLTDRGKHLYHASGAGAGHTWTIPSNASVAYPIGTVIQFLNSDSNAVSIALTTDTLRFVPTGGTGTRSLAQYGWAVAIKVESNVWFIRGDGLT